MTELTNEELQELKTEIMIKRNTEHMLAIINYIKLSLGLDLEELS